MKIVSNQKLINRNKKIGQIASLVALAVLAVGLLISFSPDVTLFPLSLGALIVGFLLSQIGIFYAGRWGRSPRPDEVVTSALKGLDDKYVFYNYAIKDMPMLLVGPSGVWTLLTYNQGGTITYDEAKSRWKQKGGNWYLKIFGQEGLGRPDLEVKSAKADLEAFLAKQGVAGVSNFDAVLVFLNPKADVQAQSAPTPTLDVEKLKDFLRRMAKETPAQMEAIRQLQAKLPTESIE